MKRNLLGKSALLLLFVTTIFAGIMAVQPVAAGSCPAGEYCGTVYYTLYSPGTAGVFAFTYTPGVSFAFSSGPTVIATSLSHGADGIIVNPQNPNDLLVGSNDLSNNFYDITTAGVVTVHSLGSSTVQPFNVMANSAGTTMYADADNGQNIIASVPLTPSIGTGTTITFTAGSTDTSLNTIQFVGGTAYYVAETSSRFGGATGHVGVITFPSSTTATTTCFQDATGACITYNGAHGMSYDPFTGDLMVFGANEINQISLAPATSCPSGGCLLYHETVTSTLSTFDQGAVDGFGHILIASNAGYLFFEDYRTTHIGAAGNFEYYTNQGGAFTNMDDLAPLVGPGAPPSTGVPEFPFGMLVVVAIAVPALILLRKNSRASVPIP